MLKVVVVLCVIFGASLATIDSNLEEDDFKILKETEDDVGSEHDALEGEESFRNIRLDGRTCHDCRFKLVIFFCR